MKAKKKKIALPRRQWQINPVTRVKTCKYLRSCAKSEVLQTVTRKDLEE